MKSLWSSQNAALDGFLIVGLGNPGLAYEATRHNVGFRVVQHFAKKHGLSFRKSSKVSGELAQGQVEGVKVVLLLPLTYMNSSGESVHRCMSYFKPQLARMLVVSDDVALSFGALRLREGGSSGGHNGLKSVEQHLRTQNYPRLRIGVGGPGREVLADYVLGQFTLEEKGALPEVLDRGASVLELWMAQGIKAAMNVANKGT